MILTVQLMVQSSALLPLRSRQVDASALPKCWWCADWDPVPKWTAQFRKLQKAPQILSLDLVSKFMVFGLWTLQHVFFALATNVYDFNYSSLIWWVVWVASQNSTITQNIGNKHAFQCILCIVLVNTCCMQSCSSVNSDFFCVLFIYF